MQIDTVYNKIRNGHRVVITLHHDDELFRELKNQGIHGLYSAARWYCGYVCSSLPSQGRDISDKLDEVKGTIARVFIGDFLRGFINKE